MKGKSIFLCLLIIPVLLLLVAFPNLVLPVAAVAVVGAIANSGCDDHYKPIKMKKKKGKKYKKESDWFDRDLPVYNERGSRPDERQSYVDERGNTWSTD